MRVSILDSERGRLATAIAEYPLRRKREDPDYATQSHIDQMAALANACRKAISEAGVPGHSIQAIALDTTGSSVIPVDVQMQPLGEYYLWCDHRATAEAQEITQLAHQQKIEAIEWCGGVYSHEWASPRYFIGYDTIRRSGRNSPARLSTAIWWPPRLLE